MAHAILAARRQLSFKDGWSWHASNDSPWPESGDIDADAMEPVAPGAGEAEEASLVVLGVAAALTNDIFPHMILFERHFRRTLHTEYLQKDRGTEPDVTSLWHMLRDHMFKLSEHYYGALHHTEVAALFARAMVASVQPEKMRPEFLRRLYNFFVAEMELEHDAQGSARKKRGHYRALKLAKANGGELVDDLDTLRLKDEISSIVSNLALHSLLHTSFSPTFAVIDV